MTIAPPDPILVDARNWNEVWPQLREKMQVADIVGFDIETEDSERHDGLNRMMKIDPEGFKNNSKPLVFDVNRTKVTGFSLYFDGDDVAYYVNLAHADVENRVPWKAARYILDAKPADACWICHNAPFELTMMHMSLGYDLGDKTICTMQLAVSSYNDDTYPLDSFHEAGLPAAPLLPQIAREFATYDPNCQSDLTPQQADLLAKVIGKSSKAEWSYNGFVASIAYGYNLKQAVKSWFGYQMTTFDEVLGDKPHMGCLTGDEVVSYGCDDAFWAVQLLHKLLAYNAQHQPKVNEVFLAQENPMIQVYSEVWRTGLRVNLEAVEKRRQKEREHYAALVRELKALIRELLPFPDEPSKSLLDREPWYEKNWQKYRQRIIAFADSPDLEDDFQTARQVAGAVSNAWSEERKLKKPTSVNFHHYMAQRVLFHDLIGVKPVISKGKVQSDKDARATMIKRLEGEDLAQRTIKLIGEMASVDTTMKLFLNPYLMLIDPDTKRVHPVLSSMLNSRRMATRFPNTMQLSKQGETTYIRGFFEADEDDHVIVSIDWSQIELVEIGDFSGDEGFAEAYGQLPYKDLHAKAVADLFESTIEEVKQRPDYKDLRRKVGKGANFNYWYSGALATVGDVMGWSTDKMWEMTEKYREAFPKAEQWRVDQISFAREHGYVELPDGHRRYKHDATYEWQRLMRARFEAVGDEAVTNFANLMIKRLTNRAANQVVNSMIQGSCATIAKRSILKIREWLQGGRGPRPLPDADPRRAGLLRSPRRRRAVHSRREEAHVPPPGDHQDAADGRHRVCGANLRAVAPDQSPVRPDRAGRGPGHRGRPRSRDQGRQAERRPDRPGRRLPVRNVGRMIIRKLRKNEDYLGLKDVADEYGFELDVEPSRGMGHPRGILRKGNREVVFSLCSSPGQRWWRKRMRSKAKRRLAEEGLIKR